MFLNATPAGLAIKAGQYVGKKIKGAVSNESANQPTPVGDFIDDNHLSADGVDKLINASTCKSDDWDKFLNP